jgi:hypothetical protein
LAARINETSVGKLYLENPVFAAEILRFGHNASRGCSRTNFGSDLCEEARRKQEDSKDTPQHAAECHA